MRLRIREIRQARAETLEEVAARLPFSRDSLSRKERGFAGVDLQDFCALARALECHPLDLVDFTDEFPAHPCAQRTAAKRP